MFWQGCGTAKKMSSVWSCVSRLSLEAGVLFGCETLAWFSVKNINFTECTSNSLRREKDSKLLVELLALNVEYLIFLQLDILLAS